MHKLKNHSEIETKYSGYILVVDNLKKKKNPPVLIETFWFLRLGVLFCLVKTQNFNHFALTFKLQKLWPI